LEHVQALRNIDLAITASIDPRVTLDILLGEIVTQLKIDAADVLLYNRTRSCWTIRPAGA